MNVAKLLEKRRNDWAELERICAAMELRGKTDKVSGKHRGAAGISRFAALYRAACADLALADAYHLPPNTVTYLHRLVARAHNQLYRTRVGSPQRLFRLVFEDAPQQIFHDGCVRVAAIVFFGLFTLAMIIGASEEQFPGFAESVCGTKMLDMTTESFKEPLAVNPDEYSKRAAFYIKHNTGIGLQCFGWGILIVPCLYTLAHNALVLGATFGYMSRDGIQGADHFFEFVTAHGPFELTAIALAAGAGLRIGMGWVFTGGLDRIHSLRESGRRALPIMVASAMLFFLAACTEGMLSPSGAPYLIKAAWAIISSAMISFYFVILGFPRPDAAETSLLRTVRYSDLHDPPNETSTSGAADAT